MFIYHNKDNGEEDGVPRNDVLDDTQQNEKDASLQDETVSGAETARGEVYDVLNQAQDLGNGGNTTDEPASAPQDVSSDADANEADNPQQPSSDITCETRSSIPVIIDATGITLVSQEPEEVAPDARGADTGEKVYLEQAVEEIAEEDQDIDEEGGQELQPAQLKSSSEEPVITFGTKSAREEVTGNETDRSDLNGNGAGFERDEFSNSRFLGDPKPRTKEEEEEYQMKMRFETAFNNETPEIRRQLKLVRPLLREGKIKAEEAALKILEDIKFLAPFRYDEVHRKGTHEFSRATDVPTEFAKFFIRETGMGRASQVLDLGCGFGRDSIAFAKEDARVISVDSSRYAIEQMNEFTNGKDYAHRIRTLNEDFTDVLYDTNLRDLTHIYSHSSLHYVPPLVLEKHLKRMHVMLAQNGGYIGIAMKTHESCSKFKQVPLTLGDSYHCSADPVERMFRIFPEKLKIDQLVEQAGFTITECVTSRINGYDIKDEVEVFRLIIARAQKGRIVY